MDHAITTATTKRITTFPVFLFSKSVRCTCIPSLCLFSAPLLTQNSLTCYSQNDRRRKKISLSTAPATTTVGESGKKANEWRAHLLTHTNVHRQVCARPCSHITNQVATKVKFLTCKNRQTKRKEMRHKYLLLKKNCLKLPCCSHVLTFMFYIVGWKKCSSLQSMFLKYRFVTRTRKNGIVCFCFCSWLLM